MAEADAETEYLEPQAFRDAVWRLEEVELLRLYKKAQLYAHRTGMCPEELVHEAIARGMEGSRKCPTDVAVHVHLGNAVRSIAGDERKKREREVYEEATDDDAGDTPSVVEASRASGDVTVKRVHSAAVLEQIEATFADDSQAQAVIIGAAEGWSPAEIKDLGEMDDTQYSSARRRVRRTLDRLFQRGDCHDE